VGDNKVLNIGWGDSAAGCVFGGKQRERARVHLSRRAEAPSIEVLVFRVLWSTRSPCNRLAPNMQGERSMSIGRSHPGALRMRSWPNDNAPLPGD
jgi:hypothetical protein